MISKERLVAVSIGALVALGAFMVPAQGSDYSEALQLYQQKNYRAAAAKFEAAMKTNPRDANAVYYCALSQQCANNRARAKQLYEYIINAFPGSKVASMAQSGLAALGGSVSTTSSAGGTASYGATSSSSAQSEPDYLRKLPDEIRIPTARTVAHALNKATFLEVSVNGLPMTFQLDTGAHSTLIGANHLAALGLARPTQGDKFEVGGVGEREHVHAWVQKVDLKVGNIYRRDFPIVVQDDLDGEPLLGQDFLRDFVTTIDNNGGMIVFRKKTARAVTAHGTKDIPFKMEGRHIIVDAVVNGKHSPMIFDTGASGVCFGMSHLKSVGIPAPEGPATEEHYGIAGSTQAWTLMLDSLKVGPVTKENFRAAVVADSKMEHPLLGQSFFGDYKFTVDRAANVIHVADPD
jgi:clan AA aspartic protease (TIGR02281 family)